MKFEEAKKLKCACVYKLTYPDGKCYIGQTKCLGNRVRLYESQLSRNFGSDSKNMSALAEFGIENVDISIVSVFDIADSSDLLLCLSILEIKYIREFDTLYPNGYNSGIGGEILGIPTEDIQTNGASCQVLVYDKDGVFQKSYHSKGRCCYDMGLLENELSRFLDKAKIYKGKYIFKTGKYGYIPERIEPVGYKVVNRTRTIVHNEVVKHVVEKEYVTHVVPHALKYDMQGNFCGEYESKRRAALSFSRNHNIPYGKYVNGYVLYKKVSDDYPIKIEPYEDTIGKVLGDTYKPMSECENKPVKESIKNKKEIRAYFPNDFKIEQYDLNGVFIAQYDGIRSASNSTGVRYSCIWQNIKGITKRGGGYIWKKLDD